MLGNFFSSTANFLSNFTENIVESPAFKTFQTANKMVFGPAFGLYGIFIFGFAKLFSWVGKTADSKITKIITSTFGLPETKITRDQWWQSIFDESSKNFDKSVALMLFPATKIIRAYENFTEQHLASTGRGNVTTNNPLLSNNLTAEIEEIARAGNEQIANVKRNDPPEAPQTSETLNNSGTPNAPKTPNALETLNNSETPNTPKTPNALETLNNSGTPNTESKITHPTEQSQKPNNTFTLREKTIHKTLIPKNQTEIAVDRSIPLQ